MIKARLISRLHEEEQYKGENLAASYRNKINESQQKVHYNFSGIVESMTAKVYYLTEENFAHFFKYISTRVAENALRERMGLIHSQMHTISKVTQEQK